MGNGAHLKAAIPTEWRSGASSRLSSQRLSRRREAAGVLRRRRLGNLVARHRKRIGSQLRHWRRSHPAGASRLWRCRSVAGRDGTGMRALSASNCPLFDSCLACSASERALQSPTFILAALSLPAETPTFSTHLNSFLILPTNL